MIEPPKTDISEVSIMEELNVSQWLVFKKPEEDGPPVRGGHADALVVHATNAVKNGMHCEFLYYLTVCFDLIQFYHYFRFYVSRSIFNNI